MGVRVCESVSRGRTSALRSERAIAVRSAVAEKLPNFADFGNHVEIQICHHDFILIAAGLGDDLASRIAEITLAIKFANAPWLLRPYTIDRAHKVAVRNGMSGLLQFPQIFREPGDSRGRIEHNLSAVQAENASALRKMPVVTNVHAHASVLRFEDRITEIAWSEIKFFPESGMAMRDVMLAILA